MRKAIRHLGLADDIENMAGLSLDRQKQLLDGETPALKELDFLTKFQSEALEKSRGSLQLLTEYGQGQQEEVFQKLLQLQKFHDHLMDNSKSILEAQRYQNFTWDEDSDLSWSSCLDSNLPEDEDCSEDPDYLVPEAVAIFSTD